MGLTRFKAPVFSLLGLSHQNKAFTLAEVLITLGIIGVVAAMTLPTLMNNTQNNELQTQFKKTYSELNQVARLFYNDNGISVPEFTETSGLPKFLSQFPKHMKGVSIIDDWVYNDKDEENSFITTMPYPIYAIKGSNKAKMICNVSGFDQMLLAEFMPLTILRLPETMVQLSA